MKKYSFKYSADIKRCFDCPCVQPGTIINVTHFCGIDEELRDVDFLSKPEWCPLKEDTESEK